MVWHSVVWYGIVLYGMVGMVWYRDPLVLSQEKKGGKEVSDWDLDQNGQFICLLGQNISMMSTKQTI